jgi:prepilin-type processing-associated H-X9-DG protein
VMVQPNGQPWTNLSAAYQSPLGTRITQFASNTSLTTVSDGTTNTLMIGEKYIRPDSRWGKDDDRSIYNGGWARIFRRFGGISTTNANLKPFPLVTTTTDTWTLATPIREDFQRFGSWHPGVCQFVFCDGSVRAVNNNVDDITLGRLAERADGLPITGNY